MRTAGLRRLVRGLLGPFDQGLSSLTNFLPSLVVARSSDVDDFAHISMTLLAVNLGLGVVRAFAGDVVLAEASDPTAGHGSGTGPVAVSWRDDVLTSSSASVVGLGVAAAVAAIGVCLLPVGGGSAASLLLAALGLAVVSLQDHLRYVAFARARPVVACVSDGVWLALVAVALLVATPEWHVVAVVWAGSASVAWVVAAVMLRVPLRLVDPRPWLRATGGRGRRFCVEHVSLFGASTLALVLLGVAQRTTELSTIRGLQLLTSPALIMLSGFGMSLPAAAGAVPSDRLMGFVHRAAGALALGAAVVCVPIVVLPAAAGRWLLGDTWELVSGVRWMAVPYVVFGAITTVFRVAVRALRAEARSVRVQVRLAPLAVLTPVAVVGLGGRAVVGAVVVATGAAALGWYVVARQASRPVPAAASGT